MVTTSADGLYYIAYTTNWSGNNFAIASSSNLQTWTLKATISTSSSVINPVNTWAPEFFKDPKTGKINIIVSLSTGSYGPFLPYAFTALDSTLIRWSGPTVLSGISNAGLGYIDTFPVYYNNQYHIFAKAETNGKKTIEHAVASSLTGPYSFVQTGNFAGWGQAEGPCITILPNGRFRLFADGYSSGVSISQYLRVYVLELGESTLPPSLSILDTKRWDTIANMILQAIMVWLGDILVIYRTYIVWNRKLWVIILPLVVHIAYIVVNGISISLFARSGLDPDTIQTTYTWHQPVYPLVLAQNIITTGLLCYKIWAQHRSSIENGAIQNNGLSLGYFSQMIIESAMIYTVVLFVVVVLGAIDHPAKTLVTFSLVPTSGIVFVLLSVRVHFSGTAQKTPVNTRNTGNTSRFPPWFAGSSSANDSATLHVSATANGADVVKTQITFQRSDFQDCSDNSLSRSKSCKSSEGTS
ncbi:hypothetical protein CVT24_001334 [Panaeolus cyanescens]|uniref:Uncharacterized protein n=1 Tax=Panaeolus cyanescens TaxID=181874 RepID=A0A409W724_9AGAR|nr:hypothetical protein CVT24_001334 [Panaeolus cyanescens]